MSADGPGREPHRVMMLPGSVLPAGPAYGDLIAALGGSAEAVAKDLEIYAGPAPPPGYSLGDEVAGVLREADARGWERFHLAGYSAGGAAALATAATHPERLASLALLEPAWAGNQGLSPAEAGYWARIIALADLPDAELMGAFVPFNLRPGVSPPPRPDGPPPPWMATRPEGIRTVIRVFARDDIAPEALARFARPVYYALGDLSNPDQYGEIARRLEGIFADFTLEVFAGRHHFEPPHRIEPERVAASLLAHWARAEGRAPQG